MGFSWFKTPVETILSSIYLYLECLKSCLDPRSWISFQFTGLPAMQLVLLVACMDGRAHSPDNSVVVRGCWVPGIRQF